MPFDGFHRGDFEDIERLLDARSRIAHPSNWIKGTFQDGDRYCVVGALSAVCAGRCWERPSDTERRLTRILAGQLPRQSGFQRLMRLRSARWSLIRFNDRPSTSHADVMALFERAIERLHADTRITADV